MKTSILHIRDSSGIFGSERVILTLGQNINREKFDMTLLCMDRNDGKSETLISTAKNVGIPAVTVAVSGKLDMNAIKKIRTIIKSKNVSIIHSHDFKSDFYGLLASVNLRTARVATAHGSTRDSLMKKFYLFFDEWLIYRFFDKIIAVSQKLKSELGDKYIRKDKIIVIQNGLGMDLVKPQKNSDEPPLPISEDKSVFAVISRLFPDKGHQYFIEAFSSVHRKYPDTIALIIGNGPRKNHIEKMVSGMGLVDSIYLCDVRNDMDQVYRNIDCLVIPSLTEGLPYVLLEAMAYRVPVLATSVGDIPLLVKNGNTGYLVSPRDIMALERSMVDFLNNRKEANRMAVNGQDLVREFFSADKMVRQTEDLYHSLLI
jgi:glycosyltransferase involved in cell wall biosynthesis